MYPYEKPIVKARSSNYGSNYWIFQSRKVHRPVAVFSNLMYENILTLEMDNDVEWFCEYPLDTTVYVGGKEEKLVFDAWVRYADGKEEFQGVAYTSSEDSHKSIAVQAKWCIQNGIGFNYRNEKNIHKGQFYIRNLSVLAARARRFTMSSYNADQMLIGFLSEVKRATVSTLDKSGRFESGRTMDYLSDLYYRGIIDFHNISSECISSNTEVIFCGK